MSGIIDPNTGMPVGATYNQVILGADGSAVKTVKVDPSIMPDRTDAHNADILEKREKNLTETQNTRNKVVKDAEAAKSRAQQNYNAALERQKMQKQKFSEARTRMNELMLKAKYEPGSVTEAQLKEATGKCNYAAKGLEKTGAELKNCAEALKHTNTDVVAAKAAYLSTTKNLKEVQGEIKAKKAYADAVKRSKGATAENLGKAIDKSFGVDAAPARSAEEIQAIKKELATMTPEAEKAYAEAVNVSRAASAEGFEKVINEASEISKPVHSAEGSAKVFMENGFKPKMSKGGKFALIATGAALLSAAILAVTNSCSKTPKEEVSAEVAPEETVVASEQIAEEVSTQPVEEEEVIVPSADEENAEIDAEVEEALKFDEVEAVSGDSPWSMLYNRLGRCPSHEEIMKFLEDNELEFDNTRSRQNYYVNINAGDKLKFDKEAFKAKEA